MISGILTGVVGAPLGGRGSGRSAKRATAEAYAAHRVTVRQFLPYLTPGRTYLSCEVRHGRKAWPEMFRFTWTPCRFGGQRAWFECDGHRTTALYYAGQGRFRCRRCLGLTYTSKREDTLGRLWRRLRKIGRRLGADIDTWGDVPPRPKGMHHTTYQRLCAQMAEIDAAMEEDARKAWGALLDRVRMPTQRVRACPKRLTRR